MHVAVDLNWFLQFIGLAFAAAFGLLYLVRNTASKYFMVDSNFDSSPADYSLDRSNRQNMVGSAECLESCAVCGLLTTKQCAGCKMVKYCSGTCQQSHWNSEHKAKCKELQSLYKANNTNSMSAFRGKKASVVPLGGSSKSLKLSNEILFPYDELVKLFNWDKQGYPPCGLLNCGNSCFANVVLQCLAYTRPLVAYLLEKGHRIECRRNDWCFFCEFQVHVERVCRSLHPFSPFNILSRLPNIGGNLGYGKQEDAHEFMRFAIDNMQSACLDEFGGEKAVHPSCQETTLIQHIFGGRLQSQVICTECNNVSNQFENMMDLTVEIHGDAGSLEECLDQFTVKEQLHGDNLYKCDGCNDYVMAWKRLSIRRAPNILTIALKRFQSGRFGKLNKRVTFPETLDLSAYMSELEDGNDIYKLYAVIVHVDMLNASFFGHYICYIKDFRGNWYMIDDCKVASVDLDEVLSQGAYMLLYSRVCARPSCLLPAESLRNEENEDLKLKIQVNPSSEEQAECSSTAGFAESLIDPGQPSSTSELTVKREEDLSSIADLEDKKGGIETEYSELSLPVNQDVERHNPDELSIAPKEITTNNNNQPIHSNTPSINEIKIQPDVENGEFSSPIVFVNDSSWESETDVNEGLIENMDEESHATEDCTFKESYNTCDVSASIITSIDEIDEMDCDNSISISENVNYENGSASNTCDVSASVITSIDELDEMDCDNSISTSENANCENGSASPRNFQDAAKKSDGESSAGKLKPIFSPGFLGKPSGNKLSKPGNGIFLESSANCENGSASPRNFQDAAKKSDGENSAGKLKSIFSPGFLGKPSGNKLTKKRSILRIQ